MSTPRPRRVLFAFAWLVVGGEETEVRHLARHLDPERWQIDVVACFRKPNMPEQTHEQLRALGVAVDTTPYDLSFEDTVTYLADLVPHYDLVVACQAVPDIVPAFDLVAAQGGSRHRSSSTAGSSRRRPGPRSAGRRATSASATRSASPPPPRCRSGPVTPLRFHLR